jgi:hypothetical protein
LKPAQGGARTVATNKVEGNVIWVLLWLSAYR